MSVQHRSLQNGPSAADASSALIRWTRLVQYVSLASRQLRRWLATHTAVWELSDTEFLLLLCCDERSPDGVSQNDLAQAIGISAGQISGLVEGLRQRQLIRVRRCQHDRRRQMWRLTPRGQQLLTCISEELQACATNFDKELTVGQQQMLIDLTKRLAHLARPATDLRVDPNISI